MPFETTFFTSFCWSFLFPFAATSFRDKNIRRLDLDVKHYKLLPVKMQIQWCWLGVDRCVLHWDISTLNKTSSNAVRDSLNEFLLSRLLCIVDTKDVFLLRRGFKNFLNHASQIFDVDSWNIILTLTYNREPLRVLLPGAFKMMVEDGLTKTVKDTSGDDISLHSLFLELKDQIFYFLDLSILIASFSLKVVFFSEGMMKISLSLLDRLDLLFILAFFNFLLSLFCTFLAFPFFLA